MTLPIADFDAWRQAKSQQALDTLVPSDQTAASVDEQSGAFGSGAFERQPGQDAGPQQAAGLGAGPPPRNPLVPPAVGDGGGGDGVGGRIAALETRVGSVEARMGGVEGRLGTLDTNITSLKGRLELFGTIGTAAGVLAALALALGTWQLSELRESISSRTEVLRQEFENVRKEAANTEQRVRLDMRETQIETDVKQDGLDRRLDRILERLPKQ